jgi:hypothetical protein
MAGGATPRQARLVARVCRIKATLDEHEACPEGACPFWEAGGAVVDAGCGLERLQLELDRPELAAYLLELRSMLQTARGATEREEARRAFSEIVPPELSGRG